MKKLVFILSVYHVMMRSIVRTGMVRKSNSILNSFRNLNSIVFTCLFLSLFVQLYVFLQLVLHTSINLIFTYKKFYDDIHNL